MNRALSRALLGWAVACLTGSAFPAQATLIAEAEIFQSGDRGQTIETLCGESAVPFSATSCTEVGRFSGSASASAGYGSLATRAELSYNAEDLPFPNNTYEAEGRASFSDRLDFFSPILQPGTSTDARIVIEVTGTETFVPPDFFAGGNLFVNTRLRVRVGATEILPTDQFGSTDEFRGVPGTYSFNFDFLYEDEYSAPVTVELISNVTCSSCGGPYSGISDFSNTITVESVELVGLEPGDFTVRSGEGRSYANVVPEPGTALLLGAGLLGLAVGRSRALGTASMDPKTASLDRTNP